MPKKLIVILILCCFIVGCGDALESTPAIYKVGEKVVIYKPTSIARVIIEKPTIVGVICKVTETWPSYVYSVKVYDEKKKGHIVYKIKEKDILEFIENPK